MYWKSQSIIKSMLEFARYFATDKRQCALQSMHKQQKKN